MKYNENHSLLKIGEVAKLNHISTNTLRYYDKIDLFKPAVTDDNGYRYYEVKQLVDLDLILWLRMNGASVHEIRQILEIKSLDKVIDVLSSENIKLRDQIQKMQNQLYANRYYISHMKKCMEWEVNECYLLEFENRYCVSTDYSVSPGSRSEYELGLKNILQRINDKDSYFNSFFGGIYRRKKESPDYKSELYPAVVNIRNHRASESQLIPKGIYGVMPLRGYFDYAYDMIPKLLAFIHKEGFISSGDCYVLKIWEQGRTASPSGEMLELQIPVLKRSV